MAPPPSPSPAIHHHRRAATHTTSLPTFGERHCAQLAAATSPTDPACPSHATTRSIPALLGLHHHPPPLPHFGSGELPPEQSIVLPRLFLRARPWCLSPPPRSCDTAAAMDQRSSLLPRAHRVRAAAGSGQPTALCSMHHDPPPPQPSLKSRCPAPDYPRAAHLGLHCSPSSPARRFSQVHRPPCFFSTSDEHTNM